MDEIDKMIIEYMEKGLSQVEISRILNLSESSISIRLKTMRNKGIEIPESGSAKINKRILEEYANGKTIVEIGKILGIEPYKVSKRMSRMKLKGIEIPQKGLDQIDKIIIEELEKGTTKVKIAEIVGLTTNAIYGRIRTMREKGIDIPDKEQISDLINQKILKGFSEGKKIVVIARELGITTATIRNRTIKMEKQGIEIPKSEIDEINQRILKGLEQDEKILEIAENMGLTLSAIYRRIRKMEMQGIEVPKKTKKTSNTLHKKERISDKELAKNIIKLIETKGATIEQVKIIGEYYGVNIEETLNSLDEQERF